MRQHNDYSDARIRGMGACIHCRQGFGDKERTRDHVPTRSLLVKPYPENLPVVDICQKCNAGFSKDEEYVVALFATIICGTTSPDPARFPVAATTLSRSARLRKRLERARRFQATLWGSSETQWQAELDRVKRVIVKNARGHILFELGQAVVGPPSHVKLTPLQLMSAQHLDQFENATSTPPWPEVGSRQMQRAVTGEIGPSRWLTVQKGVYRFAVSEPFYVRIVLYEYLAAEVVWHDSTDMG